MLRPHETVAVIGGMGPLASAAFVSTIYERTTCQREQEMPRVVLWSDPQLPDRTTALLDGSAGVVAQSLQDTLERCTAAGATHVVICCVTAHALLPLLPPQLRAPVVSLVDVLLGDVIERQQPQLVLSSAGTRRSRLLEQHPLWPEASRWLQWPDEGEQEEVHRAIYALKLRGDAAGAVQFVDALLRRHRIGSFVAACTEMHLVTREWDGDRGVSWIDPLEIVADGLAGVRPVFPGAAGVS